MDMARPPLPFRQSTRREERSPSPHDAGDCGLLQNTLASGRGQSTLFPRNSVDLTRADVRRRPTVTRSTGYIVIIQKLPLGLRRAAAERAIAMRKPPECLDHVPVLPRVAQLLRIT